MKKISWLQFNDLELPWGAMEYFATVREALAKELREPPTGKLLHPSFILLTGNTVSPSPDAYLAVARFFYSLRERIPVLMVPSPRDVRETFLQESFRHLRVDFGPLWRGQTFLHGYQDNSFLCSASVGGFRLGVVGLDQEGDLIGQFHGLLEASKGEFKAGFKAWHDMTILLLQDGQTEADFATVVAPSFDVIVSPKTDDNAFSSHGHWGTHVQSCTPKIRTEEGGLRGYTWGHAEAGDKGLQVSYWTRKLVLDPNGTRFAHPEIMAYREREGCRYLLRQRPNT